MAVHPLVVVFRIGRTNRYSFLALEAGMEATEGLSDIDVVHSHQREWRPFFRQLDSLLQVNRIVLVAYSLMTAHLGRVRPELQRLANHPERQRIVLVGGGPHAAGTPKSALALGLDAVCTGEGEHTFPQLVLHLREHGRLDSFTSPGFYVAVNGNVQFTGRAAPVSLDDTPPLPIRAGRYGPIEISRGCPHRCKYCQTPVFKGTRMRHRSTDAVVHTVRHLVKAAKVDVRFITPNGLAYGSSDGHTLELDQLARLLTAIRRELPAHGRIFFGSFPSEVRPELVTKEAVRLIREVCSNTSIVLGAQSGSPLMLDAMRRGHTVDQVRQACATILEAGLEPVVDFMLGLPRETMDQMRETMRLMEALAKDGARIHLHSFMPLPGTPWGGLSPTSIPAEIRCHVERLITGGSLFGQWKAQERLALVEPSGEQGDLCQKGQGHI